MRGKYKERQFLCDNCRAQLPTRAVLTHMEYRVLLEIAKGVTYVEIAKKFYRSEKTICTHAARIRNKLGIATQLKLVVYCWERDLLKRDINHGCVHHLRVNRYAPRKQRAGNQ